MSVHEVGFAILSPDGPEWRPSNLTEIPNTDLPRPLGGGRIPGVRFWRRPPHSANTWHRHVDSWEFHFVLEGTGRVRIGSKTVALPPDGPVVVAPRMPRQLFNDSDAGPLWSIVGAPQEGRSVGPLRCADAWPEDPKSPPPGMAGAAHPSASR